MDCYIRAPRYVHTALEKNMLINQAISQSLTYTYETFGTKLCISPIRLALNFGSILVILVDAAMLKLFDLCCTTVEESQHCLAGTFQFNEGGRDTLMCLGIT